ncbi:glutamine amidotransferase [Ancylobacter sp. 6x-1]|uniref:Glutamine amidotransferase n=1 Tax=Ancylobacter crimeensis TaxID=2579147 RepID=A0ABT0D9I5_9HYPH|nr:glutamine amidotransferase [Ancylobacter crimeensis]MCK0196612.1 glutamine amidotransferase [Ancylobacter crimeensis]
MKRRSVVAVRHVAFEDLGLLAGVLDAAGWDIAYCEAATDDLGHRSIANADLVIVLGGPIGVGDAHAFPFLTREIALIEHRLARHKPTLGICLGAQLMAAALGAPVFAGPQKEIGWGSLALTREGHRSPLAPLAEAGTQVLHWHGDTFDLPRGAKRLAFNELYENQAFSFGRCGLGLQFHLEADARELEEWYVGHSVELGVARIDVAALRQAGIARHPDAARVAGAVFGSWLDGLFPQERPGRRMSVHEAQAAHPA